jgi:serine/threonine protein phosphatase 1
VVIYAVGDVHGRLDLLKLLCGQILADAEPLPEDTAVEVVFLGDYVDRGPESAGVIDYLLELERTGPLGLRFLRGNHEHAMLAFLDDPGVGPAWAQYGGIETLRSYGVRAPLQQDDPEAWEPVRDALDTALPDAHRDFLERLERYAIHGDYCFVHAGLKPGVPLDEQEDQDLLTIRNEFLACKKPFEKKVIYGHTPGGEPAVEPHRIGIDTGAFATGVLTGLRLWDAEFAVLQARL